MLVTIPARVSNCGSGVMCLSEAPKLAATGVTEGEATTRLHYVLSAWVRGLVLADALEGAIFRLKLRHETDGSDEVTVKVNPAR